MDEKKKEKVRRIYAWIAIVLFVLLIINIMTLQIQLGISIGIYTMIIIFYLFFIRKKGNEASGKEESDNETENKNN